MSENFKKRKIDTLGDLKRGDHIVFEMVNYYQHAVVVQIQLWEDTFEIVQLKNGRNRESKIVRDTCSWNHDDENDDPLYVVEYDMPTYRPEEVAKRAKDMSEGKGCWDPKYDIQSNNCSHFATWCKTGKKTMEQEIQGSPKERIQKKRVRFLTDMKMGDQIVFAKTGYDHHAIVIEVEQYENTFTVIHFTNDINKKGARVEKDVYDWEDVADKENPIYVVNYKKATHPPEEVAERAKLMLEDDGGLWNGKYDIFSNNCEHFSAWCKTGEKISSQVVEGSVLGIGLALAGAYFFGTGPAIAVGVTLFRAVKKYASSSNADLPSKNT